MKLQIKEFARLTGVSVRTLHYYDEIDLLRPASVDGQTGYRFYDEDSLLRMQEILFYRELDFSLKSIAEILSSPHYSKEEALEQQKTLLLESLDKNMLYVPLSEANSSEFALSETDRTLNRAFYTQA